MRFLQVKCVSPGRISFPPKLSHRGPRTPSASLKLRDGSLRVSGPFCDIDAQALATELPRSFLGSFSAHRCAAPGVPVANDNSDHSLRLLPTRWRHQEGSASTRRAGRRCSSQPHLCRDAIGSARRFNHQRNYLRHTTSVKGHSNLGETRRRLYTIAGSCREFQRRHPGFRRSDLSGYVSAHAQCIDGSLHATSETVLEQEA
jgi:hypothetical protein